MGGGVIKEKKKRKIVEALRCLHQWRRVDMIRVHRKSRNILGTTTFYSFLLFFFKSLWQVMS